CRPRFGHPASYDLGWSIGSSRGAPASRCGKGGARVLSGRLWSPPDTGGARARHDGPGGGARPQRHGARSGAGQGKCRAAVAELHRARVLRQGFDRPWVRSRDGAGRPRWLALGALLRKDAGGVADAEMESAEFADAESVDTQEKSEVQAGAAGNRIRGW